MELLRQKMHHILLLFDFLLAASMQMNEQN